MLRLFWLVILAGQAHGFTEFVSNVECTIDTVTIDLSLTSYIFNVSKSAFAVYPANSVFCPETKPLTIVNKINPVTQFNINATYCSFQYRTILGHDGRAVALYSTLHFYASDFNPFTLQPEGSKYNFPVHCLVQNLPYTTFTTASPTEPTQTTTTFGTATTTSGTATPTTSYEPCDCCDCSCNCPYNDIIQHKQP